MSSKKNDKVYQFTKDIIPINRYDFNNEYYITDEEKIIDFFKIKCRDLTTTNAADVETDNSNLTIFLQKFEDDFKIISINIPTNCKKQINYFNNKIKKCKNLYCKSQLIKKRDEEIWIEKNKLDKEFYLMVFASNRERYGSQYKTIMSTLGVNDLLLKINKNQKDEVLMKINNKNLKI